jgi:hypothetical protein
MLQSDTRNGVEQRRYGSNGHFLTVRIVQYTIHFSA